MYRDDGRETEVGKWMDKGLNSGKDCWGHLKVQGGAHKDVQRAITGDKKMQRLEGISHVSGHEGWSRETSGRMDKAARAERLLEG